VRIIFALGALFVAGCTSVQVANLEASHKVYHVCIEDNPKVIVSDFIPVVQDGFARHGITTEIVTAPAPERCEYRLTYVAHRTWDVANYMHHAELRLFKGNQRIAYAEYHLNGKGGFALNKWASVDSKMDPVIDQLLSDYDPETVQAFREAIPPQTTEEKVVSEDVAPATQDTTERLRQLKHWFEEGLITQEEYDSARAKLLGS